MTERKGTLALGTALLALGVLSGCGLPMVSRTDWVPNKVGIFYPSDVEGKTLPVQVRGTPFGGSEEDFARHIATMVTPPVWYRPPARIVSVSPYGPNPSFRIVFLFGAPYVAAGMRACAETATLPLRPSSAPLSVQGAVCRDDQWIAEAEGMIKTVNGPDDPALAQLIHDMTTEMLPYQGNGFPSLFSPWPHDFAW